MMRLVRFSWPTFSEAVRALLCWSADLSFPWVLADLQPRALLLSKVREYVVAQILSEFGLEGYTFDVPAAVRAFGDCRCIVRKHATSGLASSRESRDALKDILQAADRYLTSPNNASANVLPVSGQDTRLHHCRGAVHSVLPCAHAIQGS